MTRRLGHALVWVSRRTPRERRLLLLTAGALTWVAWNSLVMEPLDRRRDHVQSEFERAVDRVQALEREARNTAERLRESPDAENQRAQALLGQQIRELEARLAQFQLGVVSPAQTARVLEQLLDREKELRLVRLETLAPVPAFGDQGRAEDGSADPAALLYRHGVEIELEGTYFAAFRYLREVQELPWRLYWDELHYRVTEHPRARVTLRLHTLSFEEAWLGV